MPGTRTDLGVVIPGFAGVYDPLKIYQFYEFVRDGNDTFISKKPCTGVPTSNGDYWYRVTDIGPAPTIEIGEVVTLPPDSEASVTNIGNEKQAVLRFELPGGTFGPAGEAATFSVAQTLTGAPDTPAAAVETEDSTAQNRKYILTVPAGRQGAKGEDGEPGTIAIGEVNTGLPSSDAKIENVGTPAHAILNITIPAGMPGHDGDGSGDMVRATYDTNENGIVDNAEKLGGKSPEEYAQAVHQHSEYLSNHGDGTSVTATFTQADTFDAPSSGSTLGALFGCISKWISALKNGTFAAQEDLGAHISDEPPHVSANDRIKWDDAALGIVSGTAGSVSLLNAPDHFAGIPLDLAIRLVSAQSGTGNPNPANLRPILGKTQLTIAHSGETGPENTYALSFPQALYGLPNAPDIVHVREGRIVQNTRCVALTGADEPLLFEFHSAQPLESTLSCFSLTGLDLSVDGAGICSHFQWVADANPSTQETECISGCATDHAVHFYVLKSRLTGWNDGWTSAQKVAAFKTWLVAQSATGATVQIVYPLGSSKTLAFQPEIIPTLPGLNTFSAGGSDMAAALNLYEYLLGLSGDGGITDEVDPTVPEWAKQPDKPSYIVEEISGAVSEARTINAKALASDITLTAQDVGAAPENHSHLEYLIQETDPTVPEWAKQPQKPAYGYNEIAGAPALAAVATSGSYDDLSNRPDLSGYVPVARTVNGKELSANIALSAADVGALPLTGGTMAGTLYAASTAIATTAVRNSYSGTAELTSGVSSLATGVLYFVYE